MTQLAREKQSEGYGIETIQAVGIGKLHSLTTVAAAKNVIFVAAGANPNAQTDANRKPIGIDGEHYIRVAPGDKVSVYDGTTEEKTATAMGATTTLVAVYYDSVAGTVYVNECA